MTEGDAFIHRFDLTPTAPGPLDGLTFAVKDVIDAAGFVTGCGNPTWAATHPPASTHAAAVELLLNSGARCLGKTITDEFAFSLVGENHFYGTPRNPRAPGRIPGGSSSGSASAVAGGEVDFALGTDTAGSVRVPSANCGLFGLRPTWGRSPMAGVQALAPSFDTMGVLARDSATLTRVARCLYLNENTSAPIRNVFVLEEAWELTDDSMRAQQASITKRIKSAGLNLKNIRLSTFADGKLAQDPFAWKQTFSAAQWPEVRSTFGGWLDQLKPEMGSKIADNFALTKTVNRSGFAEACRQREDARHLLRTFLQPGNALCVPTTPSPPPLCGHVDYDRTGTGYLARLLCLTAFAGIGGLPQISLPWNSAADLPLGLSFIGAPDADLSLISLADRLI